MCWLKWLVKRVNIRLILFREATRLWLVCVVCADVREEWLWVNEVFEHTRAPHKSLRQSDLTRQGRAVSQAHCVQQAGREEGGLNSELDGHDLIMFCRRNKQLTKLTLFISTQVDGWS
ncbi:hypothetical protein BLNAU_22383 [Blattamonas nauphoetae]|uniref:Secreted protein n=1 Tax=Blattamonas nauphoetae TaxID=2049346 RepID=A0ABQ9WT72_9EUKA|nr:hypothetical protein BLNAU_22383 [Blattamonas nauphoetae]